MTIGVLDDNPALCHVLETVLALAGYEVSAHTDPLTFINAIQHNNIDDLECIIVDYHLTGGKTGIDVISQARQTRPYLPALLISGDPLPQNALQDLSNIAFCRKPFSLTAFLAVMSRLERLNAIES